MNDECCYEINLRYDEMSSPGGCLPDVLGVSGDEVTRQTTQRSSRARARARARRRARRRRGMTDKYYKANRIIPKLVRGEVIEGKEPGEQYTTRFDIKVETKKHRAVALDRRGLRQGRPIAPVWPIFTASETVEWKHHVEAALKAQGLYQGDREYVIKDGPAPRTKSQPIAQLDFGHGSTPPRSGRLARLKPNSEKPRERGWETHSGPA